MNTHVLPHPSAGMRRRWILSLATMLPLMAGISHAANFVVSTDDDEPYNGGSLNDEFVDGTGLSLREAIGLANANGSVPNGGDDDGDTIAFDPLVFLLGAPSITLNSELLVTDDVVIDGGVLLSVINPTTLDGGGITRHFMIDTSSAAGAREDVEIRNFELTDGSAENGGSIYNNGAPLTVSGSVFSENEAIGASGSGGAIFNAAGGTLTVSNSTFSLNVANRAGGAIEDQSGGTSGFDLVLSNVDFTENNAGVAPATAAPGNGGAVHITGSGSIRITGGTADGNLAAAEGGAFWNGSGTMEITDATLTDNVASGAAADNGGGGVFNNGGTLEIQGGVISGNLADGTSGSGGGVFSTEGLVTITDATISANSANRAGGGIELIAGSLHLTDVTLGGATDVDGNIAGPSGSANPGNGGGLHVSAEATVMIDGGLVGSNTAAREGGGLWNQAGTTMTLTGGAEVSGNAALGTAADDGGGGIFNNGGSVMINATDGAVVIDGNTATEGSGSGGGIQNIAGGTLVVHGATLSNNLANRAGGAIEDASGSTDAVEILNATIEDNAAGISPATPMPGSGGALHVTGNGGITLTASTVSGNRAASEGGGLWNGSGLMTVDGAEITGNTASGADATMGGGGIFNAGGTVMIKNSTMITGNVADGASGSGGGVFNDAGGSVEITNSTLATNTANRAGGAIEDNSGVGLGLTLTSVTLSENTAGTPAANPGNGGALHISGAGDVMITSSTVSGNDAALEGGGLWNGSGTMTVSGTTVSGNTASGDALDDGGGGIFNNGGTLTVSASSSITANVADGTAGSGGGIHNATGGTVAVSGSSISGNLANRAGGGIEDQSGLTGTAVTLTDVAFDANNAGIAPAVGAPGSGGALHVTGSGGVAFTGGSVTNNLAASEGGGLWNGSGTMSIASVTFETNTASGAAADNGGGALFNAGGTLMVSDSIITGNVADGASGSGGGILNDASGSLTVTGTKLSGNTANRAGGALEVTAGTMSTVAAGEMSGNTAGPDGTANPGNGGALHISGGASVEITDAIVSSNSAANEGGGLWNSGAGTLMVASTVVSMNDAPDGGGLFNQAGSGVTTVVNTTVSGNTATTGGGLLGEGGSFDLTHVTVASNMATTGGGLALNGGSASLSNSLVADNTAGSGPDVSGTVSAMSSLVENGAGTLGITDGVDGNLVGTDPMLVALVDNGGMTLTHRLLSTSAAVDAGSPAAASGLDFDQRGSGYARISGGAPDLGAYESFILTYADWVAANFTAATAIDFRDPDDDPDFDGISNGLEYFTGMNPEINDQPPFAFVMADGELSLTFPMSKLVASNSATLEVSTDLMDWNAVTMPDLMREDLSPTRETITLSTPVGTELKQFLRLNVATN
ncbi:beta strand repeat-containing protein [Haloferula sargassicola]|uniref:Extracellular nuclease n=1 Tax=Haloferula sargassicola TaxID=490096 RepID=A0ABP9URW8_9BACT